MRGFIVFWALVAAVVYLPVVVIAGLLGVLVVGAIAMGCLLGPGYQQRDDPRL